MKITVILTGGTIGSAVRGGVISPAEPPLDRLADFYRSRHGAETEFESISPYTALSENLCAENLNSLAACALSAVSAGCKRLIICHGTDTIQYSCAALSLILAGKDCSAVFVSAGKPLDDEATNGYENFCAAAEFLRLADTSGVFAAYKNKNENAKILPAANLALHREADDSLYDFSNDYAAEYNGKKLIFNPGFRPQSRAQTVSQTRFSERSGILTVCAEPAACYPPCTQDIKAVILRPYHSGTLNTQDSGFCRFCLDAAKKDIPVFACGILPGEQYESSAAFKELSITPLCGVSFACAYIRIWLADEKGAALRRLMAGE